MTTEKILTDDQILRTLSIVYGCSVSDVILHDAIAARRIEQAVLQSSEVSEWRQDSVRFNYWKLWWYRSGGDTSLLPPTVEEYLKDYGFPLDESFDIAIESE